MDTHAEGAATPSTGDQQRVQFSLTTVDELFRGRPLAFAHWDVEGHEERVLLGAQSTLARDRPYFTVESFPKSARPAHTRLFALARQLNYTPFAFEERVGTIPDGRNYLCVPDEKVAAFEPHHRAVLK